MVTIASSKTGQSETLPLALGTTTVQELCDWSVALFGLSGTVHIFKDGKRLDSQLKLDQAGVVNGDLLAAQEASSGGGRQQQQSAGASAPSTGGGLDFSSLLQGATAAASSGPGGGGGLDFSNLLMQQNAMSQNRNNELVYYDGMQLEDAWENNTKPEHIVKLLQTKGHLFKELNYHQPMLAEKIRGQPYEKAVRIWREEILKGGIQTAMNRSNTFHKVRIACACARVVSSPFPFVF